MPTGYYIKHENKTVKLTANFARLSKVVGKPEFATLKELKAAFPDYTFGPYTRPKSKGNKITFNEIEAQIRDIYPDFEKEFHHYRYHTVEVNGKQIHPYRFISIRHWYERLKKGTHEPLKPDIEVQPNPGKYVFGEKAENEPTEAA